MKTQRVVAFCCAVIFLPLVLTAQARNYDVPPMLMDVGNFNLSMNKLMGEQGLQTQFSWMLTGTDRQKTEIFYWPADRWQSNMLYQIFNPLVLDDSGIINPDGVRRPMYVAIGNDALINAGKTDWAIETRRYRPPDILIDGIKINPPFSWYVDPSLKSDIKIEFEDVLGQFGLRSHVEVFGFSNPNHADYFIWKATHKFTGELKIPREATSRKDSVPDQSIRFWWPIAFSFGPSKAGEYNVTGGFSYEGVDDLDSWFKRKSSFYPAAARDSIYVAYYWDAKGAGTTAYSNGSSDDTGDPDRATGFLHSTQICGYTLLHADKSYADRADDISQPYSMPHAGINKDLWGRRDVGLKLTYRGDDSRGRFPLDPITAGLLTAPDYGPMRFITTGPYRLTKNRGAGRADSVTMVYAVGVGGIGWKYADSIGRAWLKKDISDSAKKAWVLKGRDSLATTLDHANWAWDRLNRGLTIPSPPPPPDISVTSGPDRITVAWSYPSPSYYNDPETGVDDWFAWRVYRKRGAFLVDDPLDQKNGDQWTLVYETTDRSQKTYVDQTVQRGVDYYYAVTAVDNGTQNGYDIIPHQRLESSRFVTRSLLPAVSFKPGLSESGKVRVVPNPATSAAGTATGTTGFSGTPNKILFVNLPVKCTLRIFTETGDLVTKMDHYGTADEEWNQRTDKNQYVSSGIYILVVTDSQALDGKSLDNQFVKFVIVR
ncbi:MAG: hypothetical protein NTV54_02080 [Ignavibacteriales bacterium]|nr:hypothetical protein [Ignavibacteriales bacterium]